VAAAAHGAHLIAASNMIRAIKAVSSERGRDPREYTLFAFGGNGPVFAAGMARQLEMRRIVVPPAPGLFSSFGLLYGDVEHHYVRTYRRRTDELDVAALAEAWGRMETEARAQLAAEGFGDDATRLQRMADLRYHGQSFELSVAVGPGAVDAGAIAAMVAAFGEEHARTYGHRAGPDEPVELVTLRLVARGVPAEPRVPGRIWLDREGGDGARGERNVYFGPERGWLSTPVVRRADLATPRSGPCIVEEYDATCVVPPEARAWLDDAANIVIEVSP
jgi:N-methylhydantoinase A